MCETCAIKNYLKHPKTQLVVGLDAQRQRSLDTYQNSPYRVLNITCKYKKNITVKYI